MNDPILARLGLQALGDPQRIIFLGALTVARIMPIFMIAPFFGGRLVPAPVRVGVSLAFAALVFPFVDRGAPADLSSIGSVALAALLLKEILLGAVLGFLAALPFFAVEAAGRLVDTTRGANMGEVMSPQTGTQTSPLGDFGLQLAIVVFFAIDGHLVFLRALGESYAAVPPLATGNAAALGQAGELAVAASARMLLAAVGLAAPVLAALFLADVALGLVNRVSPQIQVYFVGMPAKALLGVLLFFMTLLGLVAAMRGQLLSGLGDIRRMLELLR